MRYPNGIRILPTNNMAEIHQNAAQQLKHLPNKVVFLLCLDDIRETLLYEKSAAHLNGNRDRRSNTTTTPADRTDANL